MKPFFKRVKDTAVRHSRAAFFNLLVPLSPLRLFSGSLPTFGFLFNIIIIFIYFLSVTV